jgi:hypothetical protein
VHLLVRRSQRDDGWIASSITFVLYAQLDLDAEEEHLFDKYKLHDRVVYNSEAFLQHLQAADEHRAEIERAHEVMQDTEHKDHDWLTNASTMFYNSFAALGYNMLGKLDLQLTLQGLIDGIHIESQDLEEILGIEKYIHQSTVFLAEYLNVALTFDGREELDEH